MNSAVRYVALLLVVGTVAGWAALGANLGWTKTSAPVRMMDEVTGLEAVRYEARFSPGLEVLGAGLAFGALLFGATLMLGRKHANL